MHVQVESRYGKKFKQSLKCYNSREGGKIGGERQAHNACHNISNHGIYMYMAPDIQIRATS